MLTPDPRKIPIGTCNFLEIITKNYEFVDKSLLILDVIEEDCKVLLITRPRRWGKTLNFSMLQHFLSPYVNECPTQGLFDQLLIAGVNEGQYLKTHQGQYPVIFLSFKDI